MVHSPPLPLGTVACLMPLMSNVSAVMGSLLGNKRLVGVWLVQTSSALLWLLPSEEVTVHSSGACQVGGRHGPGAHGRGESSGVVSLGPGEGEGPSPSSSHTQKMFHTGLRGLLCQSVVEITSSKVFTSRAFTVPLKDRQDPCLVMDLLGLNNFVLAHSFRMLAIWKV